MMEERNYKVVLKDNNNDDEYLCGFYAKVEDALHAEKQFMALNEGRHYRVKPVNIEYIAGAVDTDYSHYIASLIPQEEMDRVMKSDTSAEINANCLTCGNEMYYHLSKHIPKNWTIIDFGCGYNAQSYLFKEHSKYIGVNPKHKYGALGIHCESFKADGTIFYEITGQEFIKEILPTLGLDLKMTFAIMNYVPYARLNAMIRGIFMNIYSYYPCLGECEQ